MAEVLIPERIQQLIDKWANDPSSLDLPFQTFVDSWANDPTCAIVRWCRDQENIPLREAFERFIPILEKRIEIARVCYYHIGFLVPEYVKEQWFNIVCLESRQAVEMWLEDTTTNDAQDLTLELLFRDPVSGVPNYCDAIDSGDMVRKKTQQRVYNAESEIVVGILHGTDRRYTTNLC